MVFFCARHIGSFDLEKREPEARNTKHGRVLEAPTKRPHDRQQLKKRPKATVPRLLL